MFKNKLLGIFAIVVTTVNVQAADVVLGQSAALSGPTADLGTNLKRGIDAYFTGIKGITVKSMDDKYEPKNTEENTTKLLGENVAALFGYVGTPTAKVAVPLATKANKIFFGAFTGAGFIVDSKENPYSFNLRASYGNETEKMVEHLTKDKGIKKIAIFVQNDAFGDVGKAGVEKALTKRSMAIAGEGRYERNTIAVKEGADKVLEAKPEAVIMVGAYRPCSAAVKYLRGKGFSGPIINISFVGAKSLADQLKGEAKGVYVTQVVPNPWDSKIGIVKEYQSKVKSDFEFISLEGYMMAKVLHDVIKKAGDKATDSTALKAALEKYKADIGGVKIQFGADDHQGSDEVYMSKINDDGTFTYINKLD